MLKLYKLPSIWQGSKEESSLLDESIPTTVAAEMLGLHHKTAWQRQREVGKGRTRPGREAGVWTEDS